MDSRNAHDIDSCYRFLALSARAEPHPFMDAQVTSALKSFTAWELLPAQAELHGMGPLVWHHLNRLQLGLPLETQRSFNGLYLRHRTLNQAHTLVLLDVTSRLERAAMRALVLKGLALAHEYYPDPALRPASDIDLLVQKEDVLPALDLLKEAGYRVNTPQTSQTTSLGSQSTSGLLPKELTVSSPPQNGLVTRIELHHYDPRVRSLVDNSLDDEFLGFDAAPHQISIGEGEIYVPHPMDTLAYLTRHLTRHMFVAAHSNPLPLRWIADIVSLVERHAESIDWPRSPALLNRLEVIYSLTPFPESLAAFIPIKRIRPPDGVNRYPQGWPQQVFPEWKRGGFWNYLQRAFTSPAYIWHTLSTPSAWWLRLQYGVEKKSVFWTGQVTYRIQIFRMAVAKLLRTR